MEGNGFKDIQDLRRNMRRDDSNYNVGSYDSAASEEDREDSNDRSASGDDSYDQYEGGSSVMDDDDEEVAATSCAMDAATGLIWSKTQRGSNVMYKIRHGIVDASCCDSDTGEDSYATGPTEFEGDYWKASTEATRS